MSARLLLSTCLAVFAVPNAALPGDPTSLDDAALNALFFTDEDEGWVVGDDGVVFHTLDRGQSWELQKTPTSDVLSSIQMTVGDDGWIVGRRPTPFHPGANGTLLGTTDRMRWMPADQPGQFSGLNGIRFLDANRGWILGDVSDRNPTGMWFTTDAGRSWAAIKSGRQAGWLGGAAFDFNNGVLVGWNGTLANLRAGSVRAAIADVRPGVALRAAARSRAGVRTWVVGDRSQVLFSDDAGVSWTRAKLPIPNELRNVCDLTAVSVVGEKVWIVGRPGSVVFHSPDSGATWKIQKTGYGMPLKGVHFASEQVGYACGAMGLLLRTDDGGESWIATWDPKIGRRAAALFIGADLRDAPLAVVARYGAEQGYYCVGLGMTCPDVADDARGVHHAVRTSDSFRKAGGVYGETRLLFPLQRDQFNNPVESIVAAWDKKLEGTANAEFVRDLAMAIRMYRPHAVVLEGNPNTPGEGGVRGLTARMCAKALTAAADPNAYPELNSVLNLPPHKPQIVFSATDAAAKDPATIVHSASDLGERLGQTYGEAADAALSLMVDEYANVASTNAFSVMQASIPEERIGKDMLAGLALRPGFEARRKLRPVRELTDVERRQLESRKNLMAIAEKGEELVKPEQAIGGLAGATKDLSPPMAAHVVFRYGRRYVEIGRWDLAASVFEFLATKYPEQPLTAEGLRWLAAYQASGEARLRFGHSASIGETHAKVEVKGGNPKNNVQNSKVGLRNDRESGRWQKQSLGYLRFLQNAAKDVWNEARTQLLLANVVRSLGNNDAAKMYYDSILAADPKSRFSRVVQQERWTMFGKPEDPPPAMLTAVRGSRPKLDGDFSDECWQGAPVHKLTSSDKGMDAAHATTVRLRYDDKYLYLAAECKFADPSALKPKVKRTTRDPDTTTNDRIEVLIDVDRDYTTYYRFRVDLTGQAAEDCWSDPTWNPTWYVDTAADATSYRVEMAIPLSEIAADPAKIQSQTWAVNVQRVIPGTGVIAASKPASAEPRPEGFLLLKFDNLKMLAN